MSGVKSYSYDYVKSPSLMPTECLVKGHKVVNIRQLSHSRLVVQTDVTVFDTDLVTPGISGAISESAIYNSAVITKPQTGTKFQQI